MSPHSTPFLGTKWSCFYGSIMQKQHFRAWILVYVTGKYPIWIFRSAAFDNVKHRHVRARLIFYVVYTVYFRTFYIYLRTFDAEKLPDWHLGVETCKSWHLIWSVFCDLFYCYLTFQSLAVPVRTTSCSIQKFYMALALRWVFCTDIRTDSDFCFIHH